MSLRTFKSLTPVGRAEYMATADRVTVGVQWQADESRRNLSRWYVAKIRGVIVSDGDRCRFKTPDEARAFGREILDGWKRDYAAGKLHPIK